MGWNADYKVINIDQAKTRGVETSLNWMPVDDWRIMLDWTHLLTEDLATGKQLDFRPENQLGVRIFWQPTDLNFSAFLGARHRSVLYNVFTDSAWNTFNNEEVNPSPEERAGRLLSSISFPPTHICFFGARTCSISNLRKCATTMEIPMRYQVVHFAWD